MSLTFENNIKEFETETDTSKLFSGIPPRKANYIEDLVLMLPQNIWDNLYSRFGFQIRQYGTVEISL